MNCSSSSSKWIKNEGTSKIILMLLLGQLVSFLLALMTFTASIIINLGVKTPISLAFIAYMALALVYGCIFIYRRQKLMVSWYWYLLLGVVNVQGSYIVNKAFQYTSITSVTLLNCWAIVWVIILTWIFLGTRYSLSQISGAAICVVGVGFIFISDSGVDGGGGSNPLLGDALVIAGTIFIAMSNVGEEFCIKKKDKVEVVAMIGLFGMLVSVCELAVLELDDLKSVKWSTEIILAFVGYAVAFFLFYTLVPMVLKISGSTLLGLSLLTSNMWAVVFRIFFYKEKVNWLYYLSFGAVVVGIVIYSTSEKETATVNEQQRRLLDEEITTVSLE